MEELVHQSLKHPLVRVHKKDDRILITTHHTFPSLVIFEKSTNGEWWWGRSLYDRLPQGHIVNLASRNLKLVKYIYSRSPNLQHHLQCLNDWETKFCEFVKILINTTQNLVLQRSTKTSFYTDPKDCVSDNNSLISIKNATRLLVNLIKSLEQSNVCSVVKKTRNNDIKFVFKMENIDSILARISDLMGMKTNIWLKRNYLAKSERLIIVQGVTTDYIEFDIRTLPLQYQWSVLCHNHNLNVPFVGLVGTVNNDKTIQPQTNYNPTNQSFSVKQPLGWLSGYFDSNGSFVRIGNNMTTLQKKLGRKFVAYGYKICSKKGLHLKQGIQSNYLSINQMVLVKLGFTKRACFNLYSRNGKIRADMADVVAMASVVPIDMSKLFAKLCMDVDEAYSVYNKNFKYELGKRVYVSDFNGYLRPTCGAGIHFFWNPIEAIQYKYPTLGSLRIKNIEKFAAICYNPFDKQYEFFPSTQEEAAFMIQFFWRLYKSRREWNSRLQSLNQQPKNQTTDESKLRSVIRYWQEITWQRTNNKV